MTIVNKLKQILNIDTGKDELEDVKFYRYIAVIGDEERTGYIIAETKKDVINILKRKGLYPKKITEISKTLLKFKGASAKEIGLLFDNLAQLMDSGIGIIEAINALIETQYNVKLTYILYKLKYYINQGMSLPEAFKETKFFPNDVNEMIRIGNDSGKIVEIFENLSEYYIQREKIAKAVKGALIFPVIILALAMIIVVFLAPKMIKPMQSFYSRIDNAEFPTLTLIVVDVVNFLSKNFIYIFLVFFIIFIYIKHKYKTDRKFKYKFDKFLLKMPLFGEFIKRLAEYKFIMSFDVMYEAGIPVQEAVKMIANSQGNEVVKEDFLEIANKLRNGEKLSKSIEKTKFLTELSKSLIRNGEKTGKLSVQLRKLTKMAKENFDIYVESLKKAMQPISTLVLGFIVGIIVVAVYLPIMSLIDVMKGASGAG